MLIIIHHCQNLSPPPQLDSTRGTEIYANMVKQQNYNIKIIILNCPHPQALDPQ